MQSVEVEHHYRIPEIAEVWHLSPATVRSLFADVIGILQVSHAEKPERKETRNPFVSLHESCAPFMNNQPIPIQNLEEKSNAKQKRQ
jgi:hypothetical protein